MNEGRSEARGGTPESVPTAAGGPVPEASSASPAAQVVVAPARARAPKRGAAAVFKGLANVLFMAMVVYVTYVFTIYFSTRPPVPAPVPESARAAAKKIEELRAEERRLLTTYGPANPATGAARIPIDRAMELVAAEAAAPAPTRASPPALAAAPTTPAAAPGVDAVAAGAAPEAAALAASPAPRSTPAPSVAATAAAAPATPTPARVGMAPEQMYRAICIACHDVDGRGTIVRKAMPTIPDFTDPKWQVSRSDADLRQSILVGKGQLMLAMKDKLDLGHTDVKEMVAFVRTFQPGRAGGAAALLAAAPAPVATAPPVGAPAPSSAAPVALSGPTAAGVIPPPAPASIAAAAPTNLLAAPSPAALPVAALAPAPTAALAANLSTASSPARAAKLRAAGDFYSVNCLVCHGPDGRGTIIRPAMPVIPDFTAREWQTSHDSPLLAVSILDGKGQLMPPWRGRVDPALAQDLVAFIRGFGPADLATASASTSAFGARFRQLRQQWQELERQAQTLSGP